MNNEIQKVILEIMTSGLNEEQKEALLGEIANGIIEQKEDKRAELIEKNRQQANEVRQRLEERQKEAYRNEIIKNSDEKVEEYIKELSEVKNNNNEYIYKDLEEEYKNGEISKEEIYDLYERVFNKKEGIYKDVFSSVEETPKQENSQTKSEPKQENSQTKSEPKQELAENEEIAIIDYNTGGATMVKDGEKTSIGTIPENQNENTDENFRELTYKEARSIVNYGNSLNNGELSEEEIIKYKPRLDNLMKETGAQDMNELYEKAREVVNKNKSNINSSTEKQLEFINKKDVSELNEEEKNHIRETLGLDDNEEITKDDLSKVQAATVDNSNKAEGKKGATKIADNEELKGKIKENAKTAAKIAGSLAILGVAIATGFTLVPGLAAGALGFSAYQEFNKGKKL